MGDFEELNVHSAGGGHYRTNRFRVYFYPPSGRGKATLSQNLISQFTGYVSAHNIAEATARADKPYAGKASIRFEMDARAVYDRIDLPDVHSDWVGVIWTDPARGFAVQTLRRDFMESADFEVAGYAAVTTGVLLPSVPLAGPVGAYTAVQTNQHHFLAGRRSWVLGKASEFDSNPPELKDANSLMVLETAAIERFSLPIYQLLNKSHGLAVSDFDKAISTIWTRLLLNFVQLNSCRPVKTRHVWQTTGPCISASVKQFADRTTCQNATTALRKLHPHLWPQ